MITSRDRDDILISTVIRFIKRRAISNLQKDASKTHSADISHWFPYLRPNEKSIFKNTRARLPWLLSSFVGGLIAVYVIGIFEVQLDRLAALAAFVPIVIGMEAISAPSHQQSSFVGLRQEKLTSRRRGKFWGERLQPVVHSGVFTESCLARLPNFAFRK